ncbi:b6be1a17-8a3c-42e6-933f-5270dd50581f [Thermothielavioides terrestris]|uniref:histidine kinase n=1 Tax=Thermothielavioides terrestris TaxID=2587410 RepID=A0A446BYU1_9PEZI|nr:b6be1a17-8a3c-42e6-933f-5270dd50581f [Thermothielavioides terrestris]
MTEGLASRGEGSLSSEFPNPEPRASGKKPISPQNDPERGHSRESALSAVAPELLDDDEIVRRETGPTPARKDGQGTAGNTVGPEPRVSQRQLNEYRENLAREMERRELQPRRQNAAVPGPKRVSTIQEESSPTSQPRSSESDPAATSTGSGNTVRGSVTPSPVARTPSYPFPRMASSGLVSPAVQRPFTTPSPTVPPDGTRPASDLLKGQDTLVSSPSTPASNTTFLPPGVSQAMTGHTGHPDFPTPNLYELSLLLSAEPGLDAWWHAVVQIMVDLYKAERVTLAVPADPTDIENVPWGQKATYSAHREDDLSLRYLARGSSLIPSSNDDPADALFQAGEPPTIPEPARPGLRNRHSFTSYEQNRQTAASGDRSHPASQRPQLLSRSKSHHPATTLDHETSVNLPSLNQQALEEHDALEPQEETPSWEAPFTAPRGGHGKVLNVLQALDYEADPLIDHNGILRILECGRVVALTRTYPYLHQESTPTDPLDSRAASVAKSPERHRKKIRKPRSDSLSKLSSLLGSAASSSVSGQASEAQPSDKKPSLASGIEDGTPKPAVPKYEEYEQAPPSPWSQSPAPSPAVRADPAENPFFTDAMVNEDSFNPSPPPADYSAMLPPKAIGVDNSWTVLHIPLTHVLLSKPNPTFKLDPSLMEQKITARKNGDPSPALNPSPERAVKEKHAPIAILSILSPVIPYPSNLRQSLEYLAPHLANSFSLARHYSNLETELNGLQKRRPHTAGFGALGPDGRPLADPTALASLACSPAEETASRDSIAGSMTSPSDYSAPSRSATGSPSGTPGGDPTSLGFVMDSKRAPTSSPAPVNADSYFSSVPKAPATAHRARRDSRDASAAEKRSSLRLSSGKGQLHDPASPGHAAAAESRRSNESIRQNSEECLPSSAQQRRPPSREGRDHATQTETHKKQGGMPVSTPHRHTQLHSYGADFASTFQSLPPSSTISRGMTHPAAPSRAGSIAQTDMTPPSDRLKGLILDSLPAHVFVALPHTGEIVWVNSRFLTYRGQTSSDLAADPWGSIHPDDREEYLRAWSQCVRTGEQFSRSVRIRRFDGAYRWFYARAVASKDKRGVILQFLGSYMDIHDQRIAELRAARQEEIETSEAKHRLLANLIPQIIFTATEDEGITFANEQWLSYTGQDFHGALGLGFMNYVHPDDLAKCRIPLGKQPGLASEADLRTHGRSFSADYTAARRASKAPMSRDANIKDHPHTLSRNDSSGSSGSSNNDGPTYDHPTTNLTKLAELARQGVIKVSTDSSGRLSYTTEIRLRSKSGEYRWHLIRCVEIDSVDFGNGASSYFGSATDINDLKLLEAKLKEAMDSKGRFLSNMSHEIRTPLIGISGMVSFLQDTTLNEEQRDYTNTIQTSANSLLMIINDILDLSKVDAGMMKLSYEWFHTRSLIEDVNELVSTMAIAKRLELNYVVEEDVPAWVKGDRVRIRQVLLNVIGNAIKFTSQGEVFSRCKVVAPDGVELRPDEIMLEFSIIDTGRGFTEAEAELIFKPFSQIDGSSTRQHGGSGLGLVISRQLVELHGGKMVGTAVPGEGSTFTFTARFGLPTENDHPDAATVPRLTPTPGPSQDTPLAPPASSPSVSALHGVAAASDSPSTVDRGSGSPAAVSSGSSELSTSSSRTRLTDRSSVSSLNTGLVRFSQAARASGQDLSQMKLEVPSRRGSPGATPTPSREGATVNKIISPPPPMYSILIICTQTHSREATTKHIEMTLPKSIPHQLTAVASVEEATSFIQGEDSVRFTHIVVNLPSPEEIISLMDKVMHSDSTMPGKTTILILSDSVQRQAVSKLVAGTKYADILSDGRVTYIYKPVKPSRFAVIFDPAKERDLSIDHNRSTAQRLVEDQRQSYVDMERRMAGKGYKVLLVEDNPVNQKVLQKYLKRVGVAVELAADGVECTEMVFARGWGYYSLILCDLHMPRKDGYQACREVRAWEAQGRFGGPPLPIIALSANVMSDVHEKCVDAGFNDYVTKPVDFISLNRALAKFF